MDKYRRVKKPRTEPLTISENEIRITTSGKIRNYIAYSVNLLQTGKATEIHLKAMGRAINKTITVAEIIKRKVAGLHQITSIESGEIVDVYEPLEEGLSRIETKRHVSSISITLSLVQLDSSNVGYQAPIAIDPNAIPVTTHSRRERKDKAPKVTPETTTATTSTSSSDSTSGESFITASNPSATTATSTSPSTFDAVHDSAVPTRGGRGRYRGRGKPYRGRGREGDDRIPSNESTAPNTNNNPSDGGISAPNEASNRSRGFRRSRGGPRGGREGRGGNRGQRGGDRGGNRGNRGGDRGDSSSASPAVVSTTQ